MRQAHEGIQHIEGRMIAVVALENGLRRGHLVGCARTTRKARREQGACMQRDLFEGRINTIISTIRIDPEKAVGLLVRLADFFRSNINPTVDLVPLATELEHCRAYVDIESARFEERVRADYDIDEEVLACAVPPLTLQPLVENALKHGILPREEGGRVQISAHRWGGEIHIAVCDDGMGMDLAHPNRRSEDQCSASLFQGSGVALNNVNARLIAHFGAEHALRVESAPGQGTSMLFTVPA